MESDRYGKEGFRNGESSAIYHTPCANYPAGPGVTESTCRMKTKVPVFNATCVAARCLSPLRACTACVKQGGDVGPHTRGSDLCDFHLKRGECAEKSRIGCMTKSGQRASVSASFFRSPISDKDLLSGIVSRRKAERTCGGVVVRRLSPEDRAKYYPPRTDSSDSPGESSSETIQAREEDVPIPVAPSIEEVAPVPKEAQVTKGVPDPSWVNDLVPSVRKLYFDGYLAKTAARRISGYVGKRQKTLASRYISGEIKVKDL